MTAKRKKSEPIAPPQQCANCRFWRLIEQNGECRLNPPVVTTEGESNYTMRPMTEPDDWCGQHQGTLQ